MAEILTTDLSSDTLRLFYNDVQNNDYYIFVSAVTTAVNDRLTAVNAQWSKNNFLEKTVFGKKILNTDVNFMIKYYPWQKGQVFTQYDDRVNFQDDKFYCVVGPTANDTGDYRIYKCLNNNNGATVQSPPNWVVDQTDQIYPTGDGYVWKFMYDLTETEFEAYNAIGYIPIFDIPDLDPVANSQVIIPDSSVDQIFVENPTGNSGYPSATTTIASPPTSTGTIILNGSGVEQIENFYAGMSAYVTNITTNESFLFEIASSTYDLGSGFATIIVSGNPAGIPVSSSVQLLPTIEIVGNGTGAQAIPIISGGQIGSVQMIASGTGYNNVTASVKDPLYDFNPDDALSTDLRVTLKPILSPPGGHNFNKIDEFKCRHLGFYGYITETDNNKIGATGSYSYIGIVKNPEWANTDPNYTTPDVFDNRIAIITDDYGAISVGDVLTQVDNNNIITFSGTVHEITTSANTVYLSNYMGAYSNIGSNDTPLDPAKNFQTPTGNIITINSPAADNIIESPYIQRSGEVYFMEDFFPLERTSASREEYKLVLEF